MPEQQTLPKSPAEVVVAFINAMNAWEISCYERARKVRGTDSSESEWAKFHIELLSIHALYLTLRKRVYAEQVSFQKPPGYDASKESVISCTIEGKVALVQTMRVITLGSGQFQYKVRLIDSVWRIDNLKKLVNGTWKPWLF